jgi:lipoate-protein ligase A
LTGWTVSRARGSARDFHARELPDPVVRSVWVFDAEAPALVLGSSQPDVVADIDVVRRRSGGGAVLLVPGDVTWVDVIIPSDDALWQDDVGRAFVWLGESFRAALADVGIDTQLHTGALIRSPWSDVVCFAGLGPGELTVDGRKVLGISQRRTREGARFQCALLHRWDAERTAALLGVPAADLAGAAVGVPVEPDAALDALLANLP